MLLSSLLHGNSVTSFSAYQMMQSLLLLLLPVAFTLFFHSSVAICYSGHLTELQQFPMLSILLSNVIAITSVVLCI